MFTLNALNGIKDEGEQPLKYPSLIKTEVISSFTKYIQEMYKTLGICIVNIPGMEHVKVSLHEIDRQVVVVVKGAYRGGGLAPPWPRRPALSIEYLFDLDLFFLLDEKVV